MGLAEDIKAQIETVAKNAEKVAERREPYTPPEAIVPKEIEDLDDKGHPSGKKIIVDAHSGIHTNPESVKILVPRKKPPQFTLKNREQFAGGSGESRLESK